MAQRKAPQTEFVSDSSASDPSNLRTRALEDFHLKSILRQLLTVDLRKLDGLLAVAEEVLHLLGLRSNRKMAVTSAPKEGSEQVDFGTLVTWMRGLTEDDTEAQEQFLQIHATLKNRIG